MSWKPLEGDVSTIRSRATKLTTAATAMGSAATQLEHIKSYSGYSSGALKAVGDKVGDLKQMVLNAQRRYDGAGDALTTYAGALDEAHAKADEAISEHRGLEGSLATAESRADSTRTNPFDLGTTDQERTDHRNAVNHLHDLQHQADAAETKYEHAKDDRDRAATVAIHAIENANEASDLDDSWWDKAKGWVAKLPLKEILAKIKQIAEWVSVIATLVGVVLLFTPFAPFGALLISVGRIAALVTLAVTVIQAVRKEATWTEVGIGVALLLVGGSGKLLKGAKGLVRPGVGGLRGLASRFPGLLRNAPRGVGRNLKDGLWKGLNPVREYGRMVRYRNQVNQFRPSDPALWDNEWSKMMRATAKHGLKTMVRGEFESHVAESIGDAVKHFPEPIGVGRGAYGVGYERQ